MRKQNFADFGKQFFLFAFPANQFGTWDFVQIDTLESPLL